MPGPIFKLCLIKVPGRPRKTFQDGPIFYEIRFWPVPALNLANFLTGSVRPVLIYSGSDRFGSAVPKRFRLYHEKRSNKNKYG